MAHPVSVMEASPRARWRQRAGPWIGIGTGPGALAVGGALADRLPPPAVAGVILAGGALLTALAVAEGEIARRRRQAFAAHATAALGPGGRILQAGMALGLIGWLGFYIGLGGAMFAHRLRFPEPAGALLLTMALAGVVRSGINRWNLLAWATAVLALGAALEVVREVGMAWPSPPWPALKVEAVGAGLAQVVAYAIIFALRAGDFTWDLERGADVRKVGAVLYGSLGVFMGLGAAMRWTLGHWNPAEALRGRPEVALGEWLLGLAVVAPALSALHSAGLALAALGPFSPTGAGLLALGLGGALGALRFDRQLLPFLDGLGILLPPALVVLVMEERIPQRPSLSLRWGAWGAGAFTAALLSKLQMPFAMGAGLAAAGVVLLGGTAWAARAVPADPHHQPSPEDDPDGGAGYGDRRDAYRI